MADFGAELQSMLDVVQAYVKVEDEFNSRKSKVMMVEKREARVSWRIWWKN